MKSSLIKSFKVSNFTGIRKGAYRIYLCISRPFTTKKPTQKIALDLYSSHTQRLDQAVREISITIPWSALGKPVLIVVDFRQFSAHSSSIKGEKKCLFNGLKTNLLEMISIMSFDR